MIEYLSLAITSLKTAKDIITTLQDVRDLDKITTVSIELKSHIVQTLDHIISEKERVALLQTKISELEKENVRLKDWSTEKKKYARQEIAPGNFAYVENNAVRGFENTHKLCCNCFDKSIPSTLQQRVDGMLGYILVCPNRCPNLIFRGYFIERK